MFCSNLISANIFTVHTKVKILPHLSPFSMFSWGTKLPAVSLLSVKYVFIIEASTASWLLIAILILQFWNKLDCWMAAVACWCSEEHLNINQVLLSLDLSFFQIHVLSIKISWCLWSYPSKILTVFLSDWKYTRPYIRSGKTVFNLMPLTPCWEWAIYYIVCGWGNIELYYHVKSNEYHPDFQDWTMEKYYLAKYPAMKILNGSGWFQK